MPNSIELFAFADTLGLATQVGSQLGLGVQPISVHSFPDGESLVSVGTSGTDRALVFRSLDHPNEKLFEVLLAADALRRQGIREVGLVAPYLGYMRQDKVFRPGEPISQQVMARALDAGFSEIFTVEAHLHRISQLSEIFACRAESISASDPIARWLEVQPQPIVLIGPDAESEPWIRAIGESAHLDWIVASKTRTGDRRVQIDLPPLPPGAWQAWIVDDIASSGATLEAIIQILKDRGVEDVGAVIVHPLLDPGAHERLRRAGLDRLVSTNSIADPTNEISLAMLLAESISNHGQLRNAS